MAIVYVYVSKDGSSLLLETLDGVIQGDPVGMSTFCISYRKPTSWITGCLEAASSGKKQLDFGTFAFPPPPQVAERMQVWLTENSVETIPSNSRVINR